MGCRLLVVCQWLEVCLAFPPPSPVPLPLARLSTPPNQPTQSPSLFCADEVLPIRVRLRAAHTAVAILQLLKEEPSNYDAQACGLSLLRQVWGHGVLAAIPTDRTRPNCPPRPLPPPSFTG